MRTIGQLLEAKGKDIWSISPHASVFEALRIMAKKKADTKAKAKAKTKVVKESSTLEELEQTRKNLLKLRGEEIQKVKISFREQLSVVNKEIRKLKDN